MVDAPRTAIIRSWRRVAASKDFLLPAAAATGLIAGGVLELAGAHAPASAIWAATTLALLVPLTVSVGRSLIRGDVGVDAIALLAMAGALALGEYLAGAVIAMMLAGGNALELVAQRRARRELTLLVDRAPKAANRITGESVERIDVDLVRVGDRVLVRAGEVVPVDGIVESAEAIVDDSALTGEPLPRTLHAGATARGAGTQRRARPSSCEAPRPPPRARTRRSCGWSSRPRAQPGAVRPHGRPLRRRLPAGDARRRRAGVGRQRRPGARARGVRRRDAVPADPGRADRVHLRASRAPRATASSSRARRRSSSSAGRAPCCSTRRAR